MVMVQGSDRPTCFDVPDFGPATTGRQQVITIWSKGNRWRRVWQITLVTK